MLCGVLLFFLNGFVDLALHLSELVCLFVKDLDLVGFAGLLGLTDGLLSDFNLDQECDFEVCEVKPLVVASLDFLE